MFGFSLQPLVSGSHLFAVLLGSTVDTCYVSLQRLLWEIAENVPFSAQCLVRHLIHGAASLRGHFTGAALGQGCYALIQRCITVEVPLAVPLQGRQHPRRCAETASHGLTFQRPSRFSCCSTLTRRLMLVVHVRHSLVQSVRRQLRSHSCSFDADCCSHACCCATTDA